MAPDDMKCFGEFKDDRICDLCHSVDAMTWAQCKNTKERTEEHTKVLLWIREHCPHCRNELCEYDSFKACNLNGRGHGRNADVCRPSLECRKYMKE